MKVLVVSCNTGGGHNAAANAICEKLTERGVENTFLDLFTLFSNKASDTASRVYVGSTKNPRVFGTVYKLGTLVSKLKVKSPVYFANKLFKNRFINFVNSGGYDVIVMPHLFPCEVVSAAKKEGAIKAKTIYVSTDYTCIPFVEETDADYYITPHESLNDEFVKKSIPLHKLRAYGIPVSSKFTKHINKNEAIDFVNKELGINIDRRKKTYLVMSGSMGFGNISDLTEQIFGICKDSVNLVVVCANNHQLYTTLSQRFQDVSTVSILGYVNCVSYLMSASDIIFTKPGGLSSTEAAAKRIPIIHIDPIPGCETKNALFFKSFGMSISENDNINAIGAANAICSNSNLYEKMVECQKKIVDNTACEKIVKLILS